MNIQRLNVRIDQTEEDLLSEKLKIKVNNKNKNIIYRYISFSNYGQGFVI